MRQSLQYPVFSDRNKTLAYKKAFQGEQLRQYENYVRWIGGFIEDLHQRDYEKERYKYFDPWVETVLDTHSAWFIDHTYYYRYTPDFFEKLKLLDMKARSEKGGDTILSRSEMKVGAEEGTPQEQRRGPS